MNIIKEFAAFHGEMYSNSMRRVYLSAAKKALILLGITHENCGSYELLSSSGALAPWNPESLENSSRSWTF